MICIETCVLIHTNTTKNDIKKCASTPGVAGVQKNPKIMRRQRQRHLEKDKVECDNSENILYRNTL